MLDDTQSSLIRPKAVTSMLTPVLTPNFQSPTTMQSINRSSHQYLTEIGTMLRKHDREASRLHDCINPVKLFAYNSVELHWESLPQIEGTLCAYEKQQIINNKACPSFAFAVINGDKSVIQPVSLEMVQHVDKLRLFYEVARNNCREVFCLHFLSVAETFRINTFLTRSIQTIKAFEEQQNRTISSATLPMDSTAQSNGQIPTTISAQQIPTNIFRPQIQQQQHQQQPMMLPNQIQPQIGPTRVALNQTPIRQVVSANMPVQQHPPSPLVQTMNPYPSQIPIDLLPNQLTRITPTIPPTTINQAEIPKPIVEQTPFSPSPIPLTNGNNNNTEDPTSSLKRLLNIRGQNALENLTLDDNSMLTKQPVQQTLVDLMPPSAFEPIAATPPSPVTAIGAERTKHRLSTQSATTMNREHFRNVLIHLVQNDDHFLDIIYQACLNYSSTSQ